MISDINQRRASQHMYNVQHRELINASNRKYYEANKERLRKEAREREHKLRWDTLVAYGMKCELCGDGTPAHLTIDHIDNSGAQHRKEIGNGWPHGGTRFYAWLKKNNWPKDNFRLLCYNCNCSRQYSRSSSCQS